MPFSGSPSSAGSTAATRRQAAEAAAAVSEGSTVAEAVTTATGGAVEASPIAEVATSATEVTGQSAWESLSQAAQDITKTIGETLTPDANSAMQKFVGQVALNTATNGGDFQKALEGSIIGLGTGALGDVVADYTGSDLAGRLAANATKQLATSGNINLAGLASGEIGNLVGSEVADETGSDFAGKAASSVTRSALQGKDAKNALLNLGINEGVNSAFGAVSDLFESAPNAETDKDIISETNNPDTTPETTEPNALDKTSAPVGGLSAVTKAPEISVDTTNDAQKATNIIPDDLSKVADTDEIKINNEPSLNPKPSVASPPELIDLQTQIDQILSPEDKKAQQIEDAGNQLIAPNAGIPDGAPTGGLNVIQKTQEAQPEVDPQTGELKEPTSKVPLAGSGIATGLLKGMATNTLKQAVAPTAKRPAGGLNSAMTPLTVTRKTAPAPRVDVSTLIPIYKAPVRSKAPVGKLTPVTNISGLTSILKKAG